MTSNANYSGVAAVGTNASDIVINTDPKQISFTFHTNGANTDGVNFTPQNFSSNCLVLSAPVSTPIFFGPFRIPEPRSFNLETQTACP
jgi:hypothetical protein